MNDGESVWREEFKKIVRETEHRGQNSFKAEKVCDTGQGKCVCLGKMNSKCDVVSAETRRQSRIRGFRRQREQQRGEKSSIK